MAAKKKSGRKPAKIKAKRSSGNTATRCAQRNGIVEKRHTKVPIGRPVGGGRPGRRDPRGPSEGYKEYVRKRRAEYGLTALGKREQAAKEKRKAKRQEAKKKAPARKRQSNSRKQYERDYYRYLNARDDYEKEAALKHYQGWSIDELRSEALDYGIRDERRDYKKMSRAQLAEWLYEHRGSAARTYR